MPTLKKQVLVFDQDLAEGNKTAALVRFLEYPAKVFDDRQSLNNFLTESSGDDLLALLIRDKTGFPVLKSVADSLNQKNLSCPCYLVKWEAESLSVPTSISRHIAGTIPFPASYQLLLGVLQEAELFSASSKNSRVEQFGQLYRNLVGSSEGINQIRDMIKQVADSEASVLVLGESGTGKEVVARNIHYYSNRREQPFVPVNCGAIPADLLESELFGHEKGSFTGAISSRQGRFEIADGGTLFLDEIGDMPMNMQVKLLRVLQERTFERVGSNKSLTADVRIIAATHQNLDHLVAEGRFRMDLYYRLNVFPIDMPPLRDRSEDIPLLIRELINRFDREKRGSVQLSDCAIAALGNYSWPGNVRELSNLIERLIILYPKKLVKWSDLPDKFRPNQDWIAEQQEISASPQTTSINVSVPDIVYLPPQGIDLKDYLFELERMLLNQALEQSGWVVARSAKLLKLQRTTLVEKMRKFGLSRQEDPTNF